MHAIAQTYKPEVSALCRPEWHEIGNCFNESLPEAFVDTRLGQQYAQVRERLAVLPTEAEHYGMVHADFHAANFFVDLATNAITVFDFDDCVRGWYVMDIAMPLFDMLVVYPRVDRAVFAAHFLKQFLQGYRSERSLEPFWVAQLPHFLKLLEINIYLQVYAYHDPADTTSWVGKFMAADRRDRIDRGEPYVDLDFAGVLESQEHQPGGRG